MKSPFRSASPQTQAEVLFARATGNSPSGASPTETLEMYANRNNWRREYDTCGCKYVWCGPITCAHEAADLALRNLDDGLNKILSK
jgi:hypothetical protein